MKRSHVLVLAASLASAASLATRPAVAAAPTKKECVDANESAQDLRRENKLREARTRLAVCLAATCPGPVREDCAHRLAEVDAAVPTLVLVATDVSGNDLSTVHVTMDGQPFLEKLDGKALPVDPGEHRFVFEATGLPVTEDTIVVREGEKDRRVKVVLALPTPPEATPAPTPPVLAATPSTAPGKTQRIVGLTLGGVGIAGLITSGVFFLVAITSYSSAKSTCVMGDPNNCGPNAQADSKTAKDELNFVVPIAAAAGAALVAAGGIVYFTAPKEGGVNAGLMVYGRGAGLGLQGSW